MTLETIKMDIKINNSLLYYVPFLNEKVTFKFLDLIQNSYMYNGEKNKEFGILYKFSGKTEYINFEQELFDHNLFIGHEDHGEYVLYKFKVDPDLHRKAILLKENRLTELKHDDKRKVIRFARRRLLPNADLIKQRLEGKFPISEYNRYNEMFTNFVSKIKIVTANELYLQSKKEN